MEDEERACARTREPLPQDIALEGPRLHAYVDEKLDVIKRQVGTKLSNLKDRIQADLRDFRRDVHAAIDAMLAGYGSYLHLLGKPVSELTLDTRCRKAMIRLGIQTIGDLVQFSSDQLLESKNFGKTSLWLVQSRLADLGLHLRGDGKNRFLQEKNA